MKASNLNIPDDFDLPTAHGFTMKGWDFTTAEIARALKQHSMLNPAFELGTNVCPWNCDFCFTEALSSGEGRKRQLVNELSIERRLELIYEAADLGAKSINFVGAGEPTIDPDFWRLIECIFRRGMTPIIYTEASLRLKTPDFARRLYDLGATVVVKMNSLIDESYQNQIVKGVRQKSGIPQYNYTKERNAALEVLLNTGFNTSNPTRLAFDTIICRENLEEIESIHRFARGNNIFAIFVNYLPSGRTTYGHAGAITWEEQRAVFRCLARIDEVEYGLHHETRFPYSGGVPCTIRGMGLFAKIQGDVLGCPGETVPLGNLKNSSLKELWNKAKSFSLGFDGECLPRKLFWQRMAAQAEVASKAKNEEPNSALIPNL